jgi:5-formaminoimidazole-4-carboxamide-1-beta-D-ribofuranosyl 5'-monophosphate synthetase
MSHDPSERPAFLLQDIHRQGGGPRRQPTGLESQKKSFEARIQANRHLLTVEKWVLDPKKEAYVKVNNIGQPKPDFFYFDMEGDSPVTITMEVSSDNRASFTVNSKKN